MIVSEQDVTNVANLAYNKHTRATYRSALSQFVGKAVSRDAFQAVIDTWSEAASATIVVRMAALRLLLKRLGATFGADELLAILNWM